MTAQKELAEAEAALANAKAAASGKSATVAFVRSFVAILILDFFLAMLFNSLHRQFWPRA